MRIPRAEELRATWEHKISPETARRAIFLLDLAERGGTMADATRLVNLTRTTILKYKRKFNIPL